MSISQKENEPAPAATETSSKENYSIIKNTTNIGKCQALISDAYVTLADIYNTMTEQEQRAWELGEIYAMLGMAERVLDDE